MTTVDALGNLHDRCGKFAKKQNSRPTCSLSEAQFDQIKKVAVGQVVSAVRRGIVDPKYSDDIVQDVFLETLRSKRTPSELLSEVRLVKFIARSQIAKYTIGSQQGFRSEDYQAMRLLKETIVEFKETHGRTMTKAEFDSTADNIRLAQKPGSRAIAGFQNHINQSKCESLEERTEEGSELAVAAVPTQTADDSAAAFALLELQDPDNPVKAQNIREEIWSILAQGKAPEVKKGHLSSRQVAKYRATVTSTKDGVLGLVAAWNRGISTSEQDEALFAPFGNLTGTERERVIEVFDTHNNHSSQLWENAIKLARKKEK